MCYARFFIVVYTFSSLWTCCSFGQKRLADATFSCLVIRKFISFCSASSSFFRHGFRGFGRKLDENPRRLGNAIAIRGIGGFLFLENYGEKFRSNLFSSFEVSYDLLTSSIAKSRAKCFICIFRLSREKNRQRFKISNYFELFDGLTRLEPESTFKTRKCISNSNLVDRLIIFRITNICRYADRRKAILSGIACFGTRESNR